MRRALDERPADSHHERRPIERVELLMRDGLGLRLLLGRLPPGATLEDARRLRERILQRGRRACRFLDEALGIERA